MLLGDLLAIIDENTNVLVNAERGIIATYDGRDSIPSELNTREVMHVTTYKSEIVITVKGDYV